MFFQRKNSKKVKDSNGSSSKKDKDSRRKNIFDSANGGLGSIVGTLQTTKNDAEESAGNLQDDVKTTLGSIIHIEGHSEARQSKDLEQGSEEQGKKDMEAFNKVIDKVKDVKSNPEVVEKLDKVKEEITSLAHALHLGKHDKEPEPEEKAKEGEAAKNADEGASASKAEDSNVAVQAVEEIQAVVAAVQQQLHPGAEGAATETANEAEAAAETSAAAAAGEEPEESKRDVEKDDPSKRLGFIGYFAMLFERFCNPGNKKKD
ncbi:uncharacterized protein LOC102713681 [Oryza brachyantha]|uniref:Uncharacterized protein n=1 Tax=Oryza brachyantha TaxID=4533 RepID=J3L181_ORYBR|nr:uncharacterized protein LOC102713681 [Oryza brachyantha]XP_015699214.1 uncharacterized protein LOC102713681 [Oryza brachyantha]